MNIPEKNKLIKDFMGLELKHGKYAPNIVNNNGFYDTSWDWLHPAYMKCQEEANLDGDHLLKVFNELFHGIILFNNIMWVHEAVVGFIESYNKIK